VRLAIRRDPEPTLLPGQLVKKGEKAGLASYKVSFSKGGGAYAKECSARLQGKSKREIGYSARSRAVIIGRTVVKLIGHGRSLTLASFARRRAANSH
jgi:hypothetical protein